MSIIYICLEYHWWFMCHTLGIVINILGSTLPFQTTHLWTWFRSYNKICKHRPESSKHSLSHENELLETCGQRLLIKCISQFNFKAWLLTGPHLFFYISGDIVTSETQTHLFWSLGSYRHGEGTCRAAAIDLVKYVLKTNEGETHA